MLDIQFGQASIGVDPGSLSGRLTGAFIPSDPRQARSHGYLFALANRATAAAAAVDAITQEFARSDPDTMLISLLPQLVVAASHAVLEHPTHALAQPDAAPVTLLACALRHDQAIVSHIGNVRCYLVRDGYARQITHVQHAEKSMAPVEDSATNGRLELLAAPTTTAVTVFPGDVLVLCTERPEGELRCSTIAQIASQPKPPPLLAADIAGHASGFDHNAAAAVHVIRVRSVEPMGVYRNRPHRSTE